jgi:hypothetical protein
MQVDTSLIEIFSRLESEASIKATFVTVKSGETNHIEFKEKADSRVPDLEKEDKRNFAKALSSFSNAEGGVLLWGIRTRRKDGSDYASSLRPIIGVDIFAERLRSYLIDAVMPQNPGVRIEAVKNRLGNGFIKCLIPESPMVPHRSMVDREYWVRLDGRSVRLEHYLIRDMMLRHANPDLAIGVSTDTPINPQADVRIAFSLQNIGRAIAKHAGWFVRIETAKVLSVEGCTASSALNDGQAVVSWDQGYGSVIHPVGLRVRTGLVQLRADNRALSVVVNTWYYCEDMAVRQKTFVITLNDSQTAIHSI